VAADSTVFSRFPVNVNSSISKMQPTIGRKLLLLVRQRYSNVSVYNNPECVLVCGCGQVTVTLLVASIGVTPKENSNGPAQGREMNEEVCCLHVCVCVCISNVLSYALETNVLGFSVDTGGKRGRLPSDFGYF